MEKVQLGTLVKITSGFAFKSNLFNTDKKGLPLIRIRDVVRGYSDTYYDGEYKAEYLIQKGDALIGMDGEFNLALWNSGKALLNQRVCKIQSIDERLDQNYLIRFLPKALKDIEDRTPFVTVKHLSMKDINNIQIPLPPLAEQRRIASILDQADELRQKRQQAIEKLDQLLQATFIDMFGDPVSNSKGWEVLKWRDALKIINGKNQKAVLDQNGIFPICGSGGVMGYANEWLTPAKSVIIGRKGNINKPILMFENFWNVDTAFGLVPNKDVLNADYLFWFCHFFNFEQLNKTVTIPSLTKSDLLNIDIPTPPLDKQLCFSNICDQTRILKSKMELKDLNLFSSLQNQAFNGTL